jgi:hypothetical protein
MEDGGARISLGRLMIRLLLLISWWFLFHEQLDPNPRRWAHSHWPRAEGQGRSTKIHGYYLIGSCVSLFVAAVSTCNASSIFQSIGRRVRHAISILQGVTRLNNSCGIRPTVTVTIDIKRFHLNNTNAEQMAQLWSNQAMFSMLSNMATLVAKQKSLASILCYMISCFNYSTSFCFCFLFLVVAVDKYRIMRCIRTTVYKNILPLGIRVSGYLYVPIMPNDRPAHQCIHLDEAISTVFSVSYNS